MNSTLHRPDNYDPFGNIQLIMIDCRLCGEMFKESELSLVDKPEVICPTFTIPAKKILVCNECSQSIKSLTKEK